LLNRRKPDGADDQQRRGRHEQVVLLSLSDVSEASRGWESGRKTGGSVREAKPMTRRWDVAALRDRYYSGYSRFSSISRVVERATPDAHVLEIGCGDGRNSPDLRGKVALYAGIDTDPRVLGNSKLDDARIGSAERLPCRIRPSISCSTTWWPNT
jgi:SAM-dependent methyltransferase